MPTTALIAWPAWKFALCTPSMRTQTFLRNTQKTSSSTPSRRTKLKTPARLQSQSAKMLCPPRTTAKKLWDIKRIRKPGTQEKIISHRLTRIFTDLSALAKHGYSNSNLRNRNRGNLRTRPPISDSKSSCVPALKLSRYPRFFAATLAALPSISEIPFLDSCFPDSLSS